jgi:hypothetical protein
LLGVDVTGALGLERRRVVIAAALSGRAGPADRTGRASLPSARASPGRGTGKFTHDREAK